MPIFLKHLECSLDSFALFQLDGTNRLGVIARIGIVLGSYENYTYTN